MPLYAYRCPRCGVQEDRLRSYEQRKKTTLCRCGAKMERIPTSASVIFRGPGFHANDYPEKA